MVEKQVKGQREYCDNPIVEALIVSAVDALEAGSDPAGTRKVIKRVRTGIFSASPDNEEARYRPGSTLVTYSSVDKEGNLILLGGPGQKALIENDSVILRNEYPIRYPAGHPLADRVVRGDYQPDGTFVIDQTTGKDRLFNEYISGRDYVRDEFGMDPTPEWQFCRKLFPSFALAMPDSVEGDVLIRFQDMTTPVHASDWVLLDARKSEVTSVRGIEDYWFKRTYLDYAEHIYAVDESGKLRELPESSIDFGGHEIEVPLLEKAAPTSSTRFRMVLEDGLPVVRSISADEVAGQPPGTLVVGTVVGDNETYNRYKLVQSPEHEMGAYAVLAAVNVAGTGFLELDGRPPFEAHELPVGSLFFNREVAGAIAEYELRELGKGEEPTIDWERHQRIIDSAYADCTARGMDVEYNFEMVHNQLLLRWAWDVLPPQLTTDFLQDRAVGRMLQHREEITFRVETKKESVPKELCHTFTEAMGSEGRQTTVERRDENNYFEFTVRTTDESELPMRERHRTLETIADLYQKKLS